MKKEWKIIVSIIGILITLCALCIGISSFVVRYRDYQQTKVPACPLLPINFTESDLIGTWIGKYFGDVDKLIIRDDGTYKQIYSSDFINFEREWQKWWTEYDSHGYLRLHLEGMRRCDGSKETCNKPGGGLPNGKQALNPCEPGGLDFNQEVILFVTGSTSNPPKGIMLQQGKIEGSEWSYTFRLEK